MPAQANVRPSGANATVLAKQFCGIVMRSSPEATSRTLIVLSSQAIARTALSWLNDRDITAAWPGVPPLDLAGGHVECRSLPSGGYIPEDGSIGPPDARVLPSGEKATQRRADGWPFKVRPRTAGGRRPYPGRHLHPRLPRAPHDQWGLPLLWGSLFEDGVRGQARPRRWRRRRPAELRRRCSVESVSWNQSFLSSTW